MKYNSTAFTLTLLLASFIISNAPAFAYDKLACESHDNRRNYCDVGGARDADIQLSRRLSDSPCDRGYSWDRDSRGVWVDHGCRAEFIVYRPEDRYDRRPDYREPERDRYSAPQERCPAGFEPGNHRCSQEERRRGCKDMRMPGGTTCSSIGWGYGR